MATGILVFDFELFIGERYRVVGGCNTSPPSGCVENLHLQVTKYARRTEKEPIPNNGISPEFMLILMTF